MDFQNGDSQGYEITVGESMSIPDALALAGRLLAEELSFQMIKMGSVVYVIGQTQDRNWLKKFEPFIVAK